MKAEEIMKPEEILERYNYHRKYNSLAFYDPYEYQKKFHNALGLDTDRPAFQKALMAANRVGKSFSAAKEIAIHATGLYPEWWMGMKYSHSVQIICAGVTNDTTKNIIQKELLGDPDDPRSLGTGALPKDCILETVRKPGVPNACQAITVKHKRGVSKILLMAYEQDWKKFMGVSADVVWGDEEPPIEVWSQFLRMTTDKEDSILMLTFTPEEGVTQVVDQFMNHLKQGQFLVNATWDDAPHLTPDKKKQILSALPEWQRDMRSKGVPLMGSGLVWPVSEEDLKTDPVTIETWWPRICAVDFGVDHPFAAVWLAWDRDLDIVYLYDSYRRTRATISENASEIRKRDQWIPVMWPHDGNQEDPKSARSLADLYRMEGVNMWYESFTNPPSSGQKKGDLGVEAGLAHIWERMKSGRFKVFSDQREWFEEFRMYHRKDGKVVPLKDDLMAATRYAIQSLRNARTGSMAYSTDLHYSNKGIV